MLTLFARVLLGAAAVILIALLSRSRSYYIAGLVPLFPTFALIAHYIVGGAQGPAALRTTALFGLWSLIPYAIYLQAVYLLATRLELWATLAAATAFWLVTAAALVLIWSHIFSSE
ncbi:MAG: GlpM family protein [Planctomycetia bacterium]|nr:GlpM family protein [Planctomycetia bacterium]